MAACLLGNIKQLQVLTGHSGDVTACDFAPNFTLVTGSSDKTIRIWDWTAGQGYAERPSSPLKAHKYTITSVRVSPQGAMFAAASVDGSATLWSLRSSTRIHTMVQVNGDAIRVCRFSPDSSQLLTAGDNGAICIWDLIHRSLIRNVFKHEDAVQCLSFTADSNVLVSGCSLGILHVWNVSRLTDSTVEDPQPSNSIDNAHDLGVLSCDISRTTKIIEQDSYTKIYTLATCGNDKNIKIWEISFTVVPKHLDQMNAIDIQMVSQLRAHDSAISCLQYSLNGAYLVSTSLDRKIKIWDTAGECLATLDSDSKYINCVSFARDTTLFASGSTDRSIIVWDLSGDLGLQSELLKPSVQITNILSSNMNSIQENQVVQYAEMEDGDVRMIETFEGISEGSINCCQFYGNDTIAIASSDKLVKIFDISPDAKRLREKYFSPFEGHTYPVNYVDFIKGGTKLVSCSLDGAAIVWDTLTGEKLLHIPENTLSIKICRFSASGKMLVTAGDDEVAYVWDASNMDLIISLNGHSDSIPSADFTPDDNFIATVSINGDFRLWSLQGACLYTKDDAHDLGVQFCDFSENSEPVPALSDPNESTYLLATCGNDSLVKLWRIAVAKISETSPTKPQVKLWRTFFGHGGNVTFVKFSPTGEIICSAASDRQVRVWSVHSSECLHVLEHDSITTSCSFSSNIRVLAVSCLDGSLRVWQLPQKLIFQAVVARKIKCHSKGLSNWATPDVARWTREIGLHDVADTVLETTVDGRKILVLPEEQVCEILKLDDATAILFTRELKWLKQCELNPSMMEHISKVIPEEFLCPITHEIMRTPVVCSDGFTYEKQVITEWFLSGKFTSPMTNERLANTDFVINHELKSSIIQFFL